VKGNLYAIMPFTVLVEVVAAVRRRTGSSRLAREVKEAILKTENVFFVITDDDAAVHAAHKDAKTGLRRMDAVVVQVAKEYDAELVIFDEEMMRKSKAVIK